MFGWCVRMSLRFKNDSGFGAVNSAIRLRTSHGSWRPFFVQLRFFLQYIWFQFMSFYCVLLFVIICWETRIKCTFKMEFTYHVRVRAHYHWTIDRRYWNKEAWSDAWLPPSTGISVRWNPLWQHLTLIKVLWQCDVISVDHHFLLLIIVDVAAGHGRFGEIDFLFHGELKRASALGDELDAVLFDACHGLQVLSRVSAVEQLSEDLGHRRCYRCDQGSVFTPSDHYCHRTYHSRHVILRVFRHSSQDNLTAGICVFRV